MSPTSSIFTHRIIWRTMTSMCLSLMFDALQPVDLLDFVDQVLLQLLLAEHLEDVVRVARAVHQRLARADALAFLHVDVHAARQRVLALLAPSSGTTMIFRWPLTIAAVLDDAVDFAT